MPIPRGSLYLAAAMTALSSSAHAQALPAEPAAQPVLPPVVVTATRSAQSSEDVPAAIDRIDQDVIRSGQPLVNLSESLTSVPGVVAQNRHNYAQDLQISIRGFGARSAFGVRGVRLYVDGIPATMPDGQGQVSHIDLGSTSAIEVLRGPFSALYGNSSGGVIAAFTEDGQPGWHLAGDAQAGSHGTYRLGLKSSGQAGKINHVLSASRFLTDGFRPHSAAARNTQNAKLRVALGADSSLTLIGNGVQMDDIQDPLGLTRAQFDADPDSTAAQATTFNTRKSVRQHQLGLRYERELGSDNSLQAMLYAGERDMMQVLAIPPGPQAAPSHSGGVIDLARRYWGMDLRFTRRGELAARPFEWTVGVNVDRLDEDRRGFENFVGATLGVAGRLRRAEDNRVSNADQYVQAQWQASPRWLLLAGLRHSTVAVRSTDRYIAPGNGDDSGSVKFRATTPVLGASFSVNDAATVYGAYGRGFETPTFNELSYRSTDGSAAGLNFALAPARSHHAEIGIKSRLGQNLLTNAALFRVATDNELAVQASSGGRTVYQNAGATERDGLELRMEGQWQNGVSLRLAYTYLRAVYSDAFCSGACTPATRIAAGNRIPGLPRHTAYAELGWRQGGFFAAAEARHVGKVQVDDRNTDAAGAYATLNLRAGLDQKIGKWRWSEFLRIDNVTDRRYAGSVIVNEGNGRFFEPAPGRTYLAGIHAAYSW